MESNNKSDNLRLDLSNFLEKLQLPYLRDGDPLGWISDKHLLNDFNSINTDITWKYVETLNHLFVKFLRSLFFKGQSAADHSIEDNAQRPHIPNDSVVRLPRHHFRRRIARTPAGSGKQLPALIVVG